MKTIHTVYEIICPILQATVYVGSSKNPLERYAQHARGYNPSTKDYFEKAKRENFNPTLKVVFWELTKKESTDIEESLTKAHRKLGSPLLNINDGCKVSKEVSKRRSEKLIGRKVSDASRSKMSESAKRRVSSELGKIILIENNRKSSIKIKDQFGNTYPSIRECARATGCNIGHIHSVLKGKHKSAKGYVFTKVGLI